MVRWAKDPLGGSGGAAGNVWFAQDGGDAFGVCEHRTAAQPELLLTGDTTEELQKINT